jgi:hypothetical protein
MDCAMSDKSNFAEYHRKGMACRAIARLSDVADVQALWLLIAQSWFRLAENANDPLAPSPTDFSNVIPLRWGM